MSLLLLPRAPVPPLLLLLLLLLLLVLLVVPLLLDVPPPLLLLLLLPPLPLLLDMWLGLSPPGVTVSPLMMWARLGLVESGFVAIVAVALIRPA